MTLDVDSTVIPRNGEQEGAARGYYAKRHGRVSPHPLLAYIIAARLTRPLQRMLYQASGG